MAHPPGPPGSEEMSTDHSEASKGSPSVAELLRLASDGDQAAWEEIMRRYRGLIVAKVRRFRLQDADARDAVQMTWLRLIGNHHRIRFPELLGPWLATTASNECLSILRAAARTTARDEVMMDTVADSADSPEHQVIRDDTARMLHALVAELDPREQTLIRALFSDQPPSH